MRKIVNARRVIAEYHRRRFIAMNVDEAQAVLGVRPGAGKAEILKAYKILARNHHTDRGGENETIVELNVAKDVLLNGKSIRFIKQENPETKQRDEDLKALMKLREGVVPAADAARFDAGTVSLSGKTNLREFITGEMADVCDAIEDTAAEAAEDPNYNELTQERAKKVGAAVKVVLAAAVKLATKYGAIFKRPLSSSSMTYADAERAHALLEKLIPALQGTFKESQKLNSLLFSMVGGKGVEEYKHPIPDDLADQYHECQEMIRAFHQQYSSVPTSGLARFENAMKGTYQEASEILKRHGLSEIVPKDWKQWRIPEDIDEAIAALRVLRRAASVKARYDQEKA